MPARLEAALAVLDTDRDGSVDVDEWEDAIESALANKLADRAAKRELQSKSAAKEIEEFTGEFLSAARRCFELIDKDKGGTLSREEIIQAVKSDPDVKKSSAGRERNFDGAFETDFPYQIRVRKRQTKGHVAATPRMRRGWS